MTDIAHPGHDPISGGLRFLAELLAWVGAPWALWSHSPFMAVVATVLLIGLPAVFGTPGDRPGGDAPVSVPGSVTIGLVLVELAAATASAWVLWAGWTAASVTVLCLVVIVTEQPRWRTLSGRGGSASARISGRP